MATITVLSAAGGSSPAAVSFELKKLASRILRMNKISAKVTIAIVDDSAIRKLNRKFRGLNRATDVLSFEMNEDGYLGDIVISIDTARRNAKRFGTPLREEMKRLVSHGALHLLGFDHMSPKERAKMRKKEEECLRFYE